MRGTDRHADAGAVGWTERHPLWGPSSSKQDPWEPTQKRRSFVLGRASGKGRQQELRERGLRGGGGSLSPTSLGLFAPSSAIRELEGSLQYSVSNSKSSGLALTSHSGVRCL